MKVGQEVIKVDPNYFRPAEVDQLQGDAAKAEEILGWKPTIKLKELIVEMIDSDLALMDGFRYSFLVAFQPEPTNVK